VPAGRARQLAQLGFTRRPVREREIERAGEAGLGPRRGEPLLELRALPLQRGMLLDRRGVLAVAQLLQHRLELGAQLLHPVARTPRGLVDARLERHAHRPRQGPCLAVERRGALADAPAQVVERVGRRRDRHHDGRGDGDPGRDLHVRAA